MKIFCICKFCLESSKDNGAIEINFREGKIYYVCPFCKKSNEVQMEYKPPMSLPKIRRVR